MEYDWLIILKRISYRLILNSILENFQIPRAKKNKKLNCFTLMLDWEDPHATRYLGTEAQYQGLSLFGTPNLRKVGESNQELGNLTCDKNRKTLVVKFL